jgi:DNA-binding LytR/AlgR family response regulator
MHFQYCPIQGEIISPMFIKIVLSCPYKLLLTMAHKTIIIVDDEPKLCRQLERIVEENFADQLKIVGIAHHTTQAADLLDTHQPDIALFDIHIPAVNAIEFLKQRNDKTKIIFITAYDEYAIQAFRLHAIDYLNKPINSEEVINAINFGLQQLAYAPVHTKELLQEIDSKEHLVVNTQLERIQLVIKNILCLEAHGSYCMIYYEDNSSLKKILTSRPLGFYQELLGDAFLKIHKSHSINMLYLKSIEQNKFAILPYNLSLEISRRKIADVNKAFH